MFISITNPPATAQSVPEHGLIWISLLSGARSGRRSSDVQAHKQNINVKTAKLLITTETDFTGLFCFRQDRCGRLGAKADFKVPFGGNSPELAVYVRGARFRYPLELLFTMSAKVPDLQ